MEEIIGIFKREYFYAVEMCLTDPFSFPDSPAVFCFFREGWLEGEPCNPEAITTWPEGTEMTVGVPGAAIETVAVAILMTFLDPSEEVGKAPSSYSFLFTVLFVWPLEGRWKLNWL